MSTQVYESGDIRVVVTRAGDGNYAREITIDGDRAYSFSIPITYPGLGIDEYEQAARESIGHLSYSLQRRVRRDRPTENGVLPATYGELQDAFGSHVDALEELARNIEREGARARVGDLTE